MLVQARLRTQEEGDGYGSSVLGQGGDKTEHGQRGALMVGF